MNKLFKVRVFTGLASVSHLTETVNARNEREAIRAACVKAKKNLFHRGFVPPYTVAIEAKIIGGN